jgi:hypothetical protein
MIQDLITNKKIWDNMTWQERETRKKKKWVIKDISILCF